MLFKSKLNITEVEMLMHFYLPTLMSCSKCFQWKESVLHQDAKFHPHNDLSLHFLKPRNAVTVLNCEDILVMEAYWSVIHSNEQDD